MAKRRSDTALTPKELAKRISGWKDITLVTRLRSMGANVYSDRFRKRIRKHQYAIPTKRRSELEQLYTRLIQKAIKQQPPVVGPTVPNAWYTVEEWLKQMQKREPELDLEFSIHRLNARDFHYVLVRNGIPVFTNKKKEPHQSTPRTQYVVYKIEYATAGTIRTWVQSSEGFYFGSNPFDSTYRTYAAEDVQRMSENNQAHASRSKNRYTWWLDGADSSEYYFLGIGVILE